MFDTMTLTKATGAVCGSLLIFLFGTWAADVLYATAPASHGEEAAAQAYTIDTGAAAPTGSGQAVQRIGVATSATSVNFEPSQPIALA